MDNDELALEAPLLKVLPYHHCLLTNQVPYERLTRIFRSRQQLIETEMAGLKHQLLAISSRVRAGEDVSIIQSEYGIIVTQLKSLRAQVLVQKHNSSHFAGIRLV